MSATRDKRVLASGLLNMVKRMVGENGGRQPT